MIGPDVSHVKRSRQTARGPKGWHRKSTGLCKCGAPRHNPKDGYCRDCRNAASAAHRKKQAEELTRLRALDEQQKLSKGNDDGKGEGTSG